MITRNNYEEFFLLYVDNELSAADRDAVESFVRENADLASELKHLLQTTFKPESAVVFEDKHLLIKQAAADQFINLDNYEDYFLLYTDNELDEVTAKEVELFVEGHPAVSASFYLLLQTRIEPDRSVVFEGKEILYKKEADEKVILFPWFRIAAAAVVLVLAGFFVFTNRIASTPPVASANNNSSKNEIKNKPKEAVVENKNSQAVVTSVSPAALDITAAAQHKTSVKTGAATKKETTGYAKNNHQAQQKEMLTEQHTPQYKMPEKNELAANNTVVRDFAETHASKELTNVAIDGSQLPDNGDEAMATEKKETHNYATMALQENNSGSDEVFYLANTTAKKSKLRGLFRKVSRAFDKNASADDDKHDVLIGGFQIALK